MTKILFLNPYAESDFGRQSIPLSLIFTLLKNNGHDCELFDTTFMNNDYLRGNRPNHDLELKKFNFFKKWNNNFFEKQKEGNIPDLFQSKIDEFKPDIITFSFWGSHLHAEGEYFAFENGLKIINHAKISPSTKIIVGGIIPSSKPNEVLNKNRIIDYVIKGESELVYLDIANFIDQNKDLNKIDNLCYLNNDKLIINNPRALIDPLDLLPDVQMLMFDDRNFYRPFHGKIVRMVDFELSRGCWYRCTFCLSPFQREVVYKKAKNFRREKSIEKIVKEISNLKKDLKLDYIRYQDESFNSINEDKLKELSIAYKKHVNLPFIIEATINTSTENKIKYLSNMGCVSVGLGIETGSERLRKEVILKPPFSNNQAIEVIKCYKKYGISVTAYNIIGFPTETEEDLWETINLNYKAKPNFSTVSYFQPWEGTALKKKLIEDGTLDKQFLIDNFSPGQQGNTILNFDQISKNNLKHYHDNFQTYIKYPKFTYKFLKKIKQFIIRK